MHKRHLLLLPLLQSLKGADKHVVCILRLRRGDRIRFQKCFQCAPHMYTILLLIKQTNPIVCKLIQWLDDNSFSIYFDRTGCTGCTTHIGRRSVYSRHLLIFCCRVWKSMTYIIVGYLTAPSFSSLKRCPGGSRPGSEHYIYRIFAFCS